MAKFNGQALGKRRWSVARELAMSVNAKSAVTRAQGSKRKCAARWESTDTTRVRRGATLLRPALLLIFTWWAADAARAQNADPQPSIASNVGHPVFASPHSKPIVVNRSFVYVANTPADTVDVINRRNRQIVHRINVGIDPVGIAVRPDGKEIWVSNHVSDSVSVIDTDPSSRNFHQVIATVQDIDPETLATRFDEPVGVAFASNAKAYVALSTANQIAVVDVATRTVANHLPIGAQDPRAISVRGGRLYVIPFESNNQSQLSGCRAESIDGELCTFDAVEHVFTNNNVLSAGYDADIVKNARLPDRDLFVFDTRTDRLLQTVDGLGTLLYGLAVGRNGHVFIAQADARNTANGRAGTRGHGLAEMENRAFLNQITQLDCSPRCGNAGFFDLEPLPPHHPAAGMALATPFGIQVSNDDATLVVSAAGSNKVFTVNAQTGDVLGRVTVGATPRGIALISNATGAPREAWVLNAVANTVSVVGLTSLASPSVAATIELADPTHPLAKQGRMAFNDANASSTGTFSCESCHPDNHTDQLIWVLDTPICDIDGCTQIPPRLTMPVRGLRDTQPYHWDGIPGDPYGGNNTASINADVEPNCDATQPETCTRFLVDGSLATTMCDVTACPVNDEGKAGLLDGETRDALAKFILSVPFPPAPARPITNVLTAAAREGFHEFNFINEAGGRTTGAQTCGACHRPPFWVSTNTPGTGMDAPTWRGAYERWMITPQARTNIIDLMEIVNMDRSFPERDIWILAGASEEIWQMVLQGSTGFPGSFARQVTLSEETAHLPFTASILSALELSAEEGAIHLQGEGLRVVDDNGQAIALEFVNGNYRVRGQLNTFPRATLLRWAAAGNLVLTLTARAGLNVDLDHPQPALWPVAAIQAQTRTMEIPFLTAAKTLRINARHVQDSASIFVDGRRVLGSVDCETGVLPACEDEIHIVRLDALPASGGLHFLQVQNADGLFSNDVMFYSEQSPIPAQSGNLISSGGAFLTGEWNNDLSRLWRGAKRSHWNTVVDVGGRTGSVSIRNGAVHVTIDAASDDPWHVQLSHPVSVVGGREYTLCYQAKANGPRFITAYMDANTPTWANISGRQFRANLTTAYQQFRHTFTVAETDLTGRVAFDFAQSATAVQIDNIGVYEGTACGAP